MIIIIYNLLYTRGYNTPVTNKTDLTVDVSYNIKSSGCHSCSIQVMCVPFRLLLTESITNLDTNGIASPRSEILEKVRIEVFTTLIIAFKLVDEISGNGSS